MSPRIAHMQWSRISGDYIAQNGILTAQNALFRQFQHDFGLLCAHLKNVIVNFSVNTDCSRPLTTALPVVTQCALQQQMRSNLAVGYVKNNIVERTPLQCFVLIFHKPKDFFAPQKISALRADFSPKNTPKKLE